MLCQLSGMRLCVCIGVQRHKERQKKRETELYKIGHYYFREHKKVLRFKKAIFIKKFLQTVHGLQLYFSDS